MINLDSKDFVERLKRIKPFMGQDDLYLKTYGLLVKYKKGELTLVATNGHILQEQIFTVEVEDSHDDFGFIIKPKDVENLIKILPKAKFDKIKMIASHEYVEFRNSVFNYGCETLKTNLYANYERYMPTGEMEQSAPFNADLMMTALKALDIQKTGVVIRREKGAESSASFVVQGTEGERTLCLVQPRRS